jgi:hypothetical protein
MKRIEEKNREAMQKEAEDQAKIAAAEAETVKNRKSTFLSLIFITFVLYTKTAAINIIGSLKDSLTKQLLDAQWRLTTISLG